MPKTKEERNAYARAWRARNLEKVRAYERDWNAEHRVEKSAYLLKWQRSNKDLVIEHLGGKCAHCGIEFNGINRAIFDCHHIDPNTKDREVSRKSPMSEGFWGEVDKCILLCKNCHAMVHIVETKEVLSD